MTSAPGTSVVVFTRDLRVRDHPALVAAAAADRVVPLFVLDDVVVGAHSSVNRTAFLLDCLVDLRSNLQDLGADLVLRRGDWVDEVEQVVARHGRPTGAPQRRRQRAGAAADTPTALPAGARRGRGGRPPGHHRGAAGGDRSQQWR